MHNTLFATEINFGSRTDRRNAIVLLTARMSLDVPGPQVDGPRALPRDGFSTPSLAQTPTNSPILGPTRDAAQYISSVNSYAGRAKDRFLHSGGHFRHLANFLTVSNDGLARLAPYEPSDSFQSVNIRYLPSGGEKFTSTAFESSRSSPSATRCGVEPRPVSLIFLRGLPSPEAIAQLGAEYKIDPEFFRRHLSFLQPKKYYDLPELPSALRRMIRLRLTTICTFEAAISLKDVKRSRMEELELVRMQQQQLCAGKRVGDSIIRRFSVHNETVFTLEQDISVCARKQKNGGWSGKCPFQATLHGC